jgi:hypothetical protein
MYTIRASIKNQNQSVKYHHRVSCLPAVGAVLGRPGPLGLVAMSIAGRLGLAAGRARLHVTARHIAGGLWASTVATASSSGEWRVGAVVAACTSRVWWVRTVVVTIASGEWRLRSMALAARRVGSSSSVGDNYSRSLAVTKSDGGSLSGAGNRVGARVGAMTRTGTRARVRAMARAGARARARA